jgi:uncharacterized protein (DUF4415 family)
MLKKSKNLSAKRIEEIKAFKVTDFSDLPELTAEQAAKMKPRYPEHFRPLKIAIQLRIDSDVLAWFKRDGKGYQTRINEVLRDAMLRSQV